MKRLKNGDMRERTQFRRRLAKKSTYSDPEEAEKVSENKKSGESNGRERVGMDGLVLT
jgi:hypothetical protein